MTEQEQLTRILNSIETITGQIESINHRLDRIEESTATDRKRLEEEVKRWDDRFFQLVKEQGQTARTIIIAAASVTVLSPALGAAVDFFSRFLIQP
jgi:MerR family transcriptional regulator, repressor of the yfmOP operon